MRTLYAACLSRLGLSQSEAAAIHGCRLDTVKSWSSGRNPAPQGAFDDLRALEARVTHHSDALREAWEAAGSGPIEINDAEAGGPSLMGLADFILGTTGPVSIGETPATRAARQVRGVGRPN